MSSILDALNKLEEEKAQARRDAEGGPIDPEVAARELLGETATQPAMSLHLSPSRIAAMAGAGVIAVLMVAAIVSYLVVRGVVRDNAPAAGTLTASAPEMPPVPPQPDAMVSAPPSEDRQVVVQRPAETGPLEVTPVETEPAESAAADVPPPEPEPEPEPVSAPPPQPEAAPATVSRDEPPQEIAPEPAPRPTERERVAKAEPIPPPEPERVTAEPEFDTPEIGSAPPRREERIFASPSRDTASVKPDPLPEKPWTSQPFFSPRDQSEFGFDEFTINMTKVADDRSPFSFAYINSVKVFIGERVGMSSLRLTQVGNMEVGLQDIETGQRYYFRNR